MRTTIPRIAPPVYFLAGLIAMILLSSFVPIARWLHYPWRYLGILFVASGFSLGLGSGLYFRKLGTNPRPGAKATLIVTTGPFKYTRNPMYLGLTTMLIGTAVLLGTVSPVFVIPVFFILVQTQFIIREEKWMEDWFGQPYLEYKKKTPRWLI